jgi:hypothetical protein
VGCIFNSPGPIITREIPCIYKVIKKKTNQSKRCTLLLVMSLRNPMQISVQFVGVDNLWSQTLNNKICFMNYNCAFYDYYYLIIEKILKINKSNILHS